MNPETIKLILIAIALIALLLSSCSKPEEPRAAHPPEGLLPASAKGHGLYSWRLGREWYHTLVSATNRAKTIEESRRARPSLMTRGLASHCAASTTSKSRSSVCLPARR